MTARQSLFASDLFGDDIQKIKPAINIDGSDSTIFDNALELLTDGSLIFREGSQIAMKGGYKCGSESSVTVKSFVGED
jgi:glutamate synthase domain-containing protein 1